MSLVLLGMSHRSAPVELRERYAVDDVRPALEKLLAGPEIREAVLVSTCNRVEALALGRSREEAEQRLRRFFEVELTGGPPLAGLEGALYAHADASAVRHAFRVACSVDSMVVGEPQILGQVKQAYRAALSCGACGPVLSRLYQRAFATAKRVRNETRVAERPVSVARVAVELAEQIFESLADKSALLVGAGEMTELALETLRRHGLARIRVANRTRQRAAALAERFAAEALSLEELPGALPDSDVVLTSIGGDEPILTVARVRAALRQRRNRPIFLIDIGVPRNVEPAVNDLDNVYLYDLDDLQAVAEANADHRRREVDRAEEIVVEEQQRFEAWLTSLQAVPTIRTLRGRAEAIRARESERLLSGVELDATQRMAVDRLTRAIVNKVLHAPLSRLRAEAEREEGLAALEVARVLFALDDPEAPGAEADRAGEGAGCSDPHRSGEEGE